MANAPATDAPSHAERRTAGRNTMKIISDTGTAEFEIVRNDEADPYSGYRIALKIRTTTGEFSGANGCVHISDFDRFTARFPEFLRIREGDAILDMTEGCRLEFFRWNQKGDIGLKATVSQSLVGHDSIRSTPVSLAGTFKLDSESLNAIQREFANIK